MHDLSVRSLTLRRGDRMIFSELTFSVGAGELMHVQGRNGAGKTTLLETLCGLRRPSEGVMEHLPTDGERHWLGHRNGLNPALSPLENLHFWCALNGAPTGGITAALAQLGLMSQRHRPCGTLSIGQRRRAALARLLAVRRPWWFLDEPLSGVDAAGLELIAGMLDEHVASGGAAVVSSHQPLPGMLPKQRQLVLGA